jgi:hypothetical protein
MTEAEAEGILDQQVNQMEALQSTLSVNQELIEKNKRLLAEEKGTVDRLRPERAKAEAMAQRAMASLRGKGEKERKLCSWYVPFKPRENPSLNILFQVLGVHTTLPIILWTCFSRSRIGE